tara:strand:+ start:5730 stop:8213 length:2484 start_codon:yes stop_codon:yes gene_type:complete
MDFYSDVQVLGNNILLRGVKDGVRYSKKVPYQPTLFVSSNTPTEYKTIDGLTVSPVHFETITEARDFYKQYEDVANVIVYGSNLFNYTYINDYYPGHIDYDSKLLRIATIDIEVASENGFPDPENAIEEVVSITIGINGSYTVFGCGDFDNKHEDVRYVKCDNEKNLLLNFLDFWAADYPNIVTGWYIQLFDIPYLINRITNVMGEKVAKKLSPWNRIYERTINQGYRRSQAYDIIGIAELDYLGLYHRYTFTQQESYKLDHIAWVELKRKKLDYSEYGNLHILYKEDYQKFIEYNIRDVYLVDALDDKMHLIEMAISVAYLTKVNFADVHKQVRMWDTITHNYLLSKNIVVPPKKTYAKTSEYAGAYVKQPILGEHKWIVSLDLASMYPHIIMQFNIGPDTIINEHMDIDIEDLIHERITEPLSDTYSVAGNGSMYRKDFDGILSELMSEFYDGRSIAKKKMLEAKQRFEKTKSFEDEKDISKYDHLQQAMKVTLNSAYGAMGSQYFRFYDLRNAEAVTISGQVIIRFIETKLNKYLNKLLETKDYDYVLASDTDSVYLRLDGLVTKTFDNSQKVNREKVTKFLDKVCSQKLEPLIDTWYKDLAKTLNSKQKMKMKREVIATNGIWTNKKRYALNVLNNEGVQYSEPKMKIMGLEVVRSSTPQVCRDAIKEALRIMLNESEAELVSHITKFEQEYMKMPFEDIAKPSGINGLEKYTDRNNIFSKGTPFHVKGALFFNHMVKKHKLEHKYDLIKEGEKIKFCYLKEPNPTQSFVLSISTILPKEFGVEKYIDYEQQFQKTFLDPVKNIADIIGWKTDNSATLESFFG